ncbi:hypothetical protein [Streptomyces odontomachi]|uniref:hypothetical protein n=1 Tax=Streptomyces odontomachi TaxID=2944940 RepID=UPI00210E9E82|nr:hypothetical protein [Streptomyces sp. ODS25]
MTRDRWSKVVREQLGLGRLLPLGGPEDGAWLTESAARAALRRTARTVPQARLGTLRIALADPEAPVAHRSTVPPPPSALPHGPLRVEAAFAVPAGQPIPEVAGRLREVLWAGATERLGLAVDEVDLRVTALLDQPPARAEEVGAGSTRPRSAGGGGPIGPPPGVVGPPGTSDWDPHRHGTHGSHGTFGPDGHGSHGGAATGSGTAGAGEDDAGDEERVAAAVRAVRGVAGLTGRLGGLGHPVRIDDRPDAGAAGGAALPTRHVRVEIAVTRDGYPLDVARAVRRAAADALADRPTVAVLITDLP